MSYIEGFDRKQGMVTLEFLDDYTEEDSIVRLIDEYVDHLDMERLGFKRAEPLIIGRPSYNPRDLLKLYIFGYQNKTRSSRQLELLTKKNKDAIWLMRKLSPDHKTIAEFRRNNKESLKLVFKDFVNFCNDLGLYGKTTVAIDGTKMRANNSKKNTYNKKKIDRHKKYIDEKTEEYLKALDEADKEEDNLPEMPSSEKIKEKLEAFKKRKRRFEELEEKLEESGESEISLVDKDARLMKIHHGHIEPGYNVQTTVDSEHKLIADFEIIQNPTDQGQLLPMAKRAKELFEVEELEVLADKGYYKTDDILECIKEHITPYVSKQIAANGTKDKDFYADKFIYDPENDGYICPAGKLLNKKLTKKYKNSKEIHGYNYCNPIECQNCLLKTRCTKNKRGRTIFRHISQTELDRVNAEKPENIPKYRLRQTIVEHPFGTIKRNWDTDYFLTRGKESVTAEMALSFLAYNFKRAANILGVKGILEKLREKNELVMA